MIPPPPPLSSSSDAETPRLACFSRRLDRCGLLRQKGSGDVLGLEAGDEPVERFSGCSGSGTMSVEEGDEPQLLPPAECGLSATAAARCIGQLGLRAEGGGAATAAAGAEATVKPPKLLLSSEVYSRSAEPFRISPF